MVLPGGAGPMARDLPCRAMSGPYPSRTAPRRWAVRAAFAVARHPSLWGTAITQVFRLAPAGWWRRTPYLPLPDPGYFGFRMQTAYGDSAAPPVPADVIAYLHWCKAWPHLTD